MPQVLNFIPIDTVCHATLIREASFCMAINAETHNRSTYRLWGYRCSGPNKIAISCSIFWKGGWKDCKNQRYRHVFVVRKVPYEFRIALAAHIK